MPATRCLGMRAVTLVLAVSAAQSVAKWQFAARLLDTAPWFVPDWNRFQTCVRLFSYAGTRRAHAGELSAPAGRCSAADSGSCLRAAALRGRQRRRRGGLASNAGGGAGGQGGGSTGGGEAGGGSTGGGAAGAGGVAAGGGAGSSSLPAFHDDFESGSVDPARWTERINGGLDCRRRPPASRRAERLHVSASGFSVLLAAEGAPILPAPNNTFYGRVWLYVPRDAARKCARGLDRGRRRRQRPARGAHRHERRGIAGQPVARRRGRSARAERAAHGRDLALCRVQDGQRRARALARRPPHRRSIHQRLGGGRFTERQHRAEERLVTDLRSAAHRLGAQRGRIFYDDVALDHARIGCE